MLDTGSGNEVFDSWDDVRKHHIMTSLLLYKTRRVASLVSWFVIQDKSMKDDFVRKDRGRTIKRFLLVFYKSLTNTENG